MAAALEALEALEAPEALEALEARRRVCGGTDAERETAARKERKGHEQLRDEKPPDQQQRELVRTRILESFGSRRMRTKQALPRRD